MRTNNCKNCTNRHFDPERGIICQLNPTESSHVEQCPQYIMDTDLKKEEPALPSAESFSVILGMLTIMSSDSLKKLVETQYLFIYRGARALLYRPYNSYYDEYINILSMIPDSLIQARTYGMWSEVKNMIMNSQEDSLYLRDEVWKMIKDLPDEVFQFQEKQMVRRVLQKIPDVPQYSPVQHALSTLNAIPMDRISGDKQQNFRALINELSAYKQYNEEIKTALTTIKAQSVTTLDYEVLESIINKTQYQKQKEVRIYYLDNVIDSARRLIREAKKENRRVSQTELQKLIDGM